MSLKKINLCWILCPISQFFVIYISSTQYHLLHQIFCQQKTLGTHQQKNNIKKTTDLWPRPEILKKKKKRHLGTDSQQKHYSLLPPAVTLTWAILYLRVSTLSPVVDSRPTLMATVRGEIWNPGKSGMSAKEEDNLVLMTLSLKLI